MHNRGQNGINKFFLENLTEEYRVLLLEVVNMSLTTGIYYDAWKTSRVIPIFKKGKDPKLFKAWRPVSIADTLQTVTEKHAAAQLLKYLELNDLLIDEQNGFRSHRSCATALAMLRNHVFLKEKKYLAAVFVDGANAFGTPSHNQILNRLWQIMTDESFEWFKNFLSDRKFYVEVNGERSQIKTLPNRGCPQGAGCSPVIFSFIINNMKMAYTGDGNIILFADDLLVIVEGNRERNQ